MSHTDHRHALITHTQYETGNMHSWFCECLKNFGEMLAVVSWDDGGDMIFVTISTFLFFKCYPEIWKEGSLYFV